MDGNSVAASSSSTCMAESIALISSREVSITVREVRVSSVLKMSLHFFSSSAVLEMCGRVCVCVCETGGRRQEAGRQMIDLVEAHIIEELRETVEHMLTS